MKRAFAIVCIASGALVAGCPCPQPTSFASWHFENDCATETCGFDVTQGSAMRSDALVAGEHALHMTAGTRMNQMLMEQVPPQQLDQVMSVSLVARCEHRSSIRFSMVVSETRAGDAAFAIPTLRTLTGSVAPDTQWGSQTATLGAVMGGSDAGHVTSSTIVSLEVEVDPLGDCWIDELGVARGRNFCG